MLNNEERCEIIDKFGKIFVELVRDSTFKIIQNTLSGHFQDEQSKKFASTFSELSMEDKEFVKEFLAHVVDTTISKVLCFFEQHCPSRINLNNCVIQLIYSEKGEYFSIAEYFDINEVNGKLVGELENWITKFSDYEASIVVS
ncbi:MAG: hypothetical protein LBE13_16010 [Bacteroidales bacterium]|jgi:hypothetical protein|nr:hypothetical protein [Bacteroidales bacterium]